MPSDALVWVNQGEFLWFEVDVTHTSYRFPGVLQLPPSGVVQLSIRNAHYYHTKTFHENIDNCATTFHWNAVD